MSGECDKCGHHVVDCVCKEIENKRQKTLREEGREYVCNPSDILELLCKKKQKWGMFASVYFNGIDQEYQLRELFKAAPWLTQDEAFNLMFNDGCYFFFDSEEIMYDAYNQTVGDNGPTRLNNYDGFCRVYALTCDPDGQLRTENT